MSAIQVIVRGLLLCTMIAAGALALDQYQGRRFEVTDADHSRFTLVTWKYWGLTQERHVVNYNTQDDIWEFEKEGQRVTINWKI